MHISDLHRQGAERLQNADYSPRRLVLLHTGVSLGASLLLAVINILFTRMIANTGGLGGMGTRSLLETVQVMVELAVSVALPFWEIGLVRAALNWARGEVARPNTLLEGFHRFGSVLGMRVMTAVLFLAIGMAVLNIGGLLFALSPFSGELMEAIAPFVKPMTNAEMENLLTEEAIARIVDGAMPMLVLCAVLLVAVMIPVGYRIRFADFALMDGNRPLISLLESTRITRGNVWRLVKLDLSFWWFYLLQFLSVTLCYGDQILKWAGVPLPMSADGAYILFFALGIVCQGVLLWYYQAKVSVTYGLAYEALCSPAVSQNG